MRYANGILTQHRHKFVYPLIALALMAVAGCATATLNKIKTLYQEGKYAEVLQEEKAQSCEKRDPACLQTNLIVADSALRVGDRDIALTASQRAVVQAESNTPEQVRALKILAETQFQQINSLSGTEALSVAEKLKETADQLARSDPASGIGAYYGCRADSILLTPAFSKAILTGEGRDSSLQAINHLKERCAVVALSDPNFSEALRVLLRDLDNFRDALSPP